MATRRRKPIVILSGLAIEAKSATLPGRLSRALSQGWQSAKCNCTPLGILRALFSDRVALPVACLGGAAALFFAVAEMQQPCAVSAAAALPWFMSVFFKEGGEK